MTTKHNGWKVALRMAVLAVIGLIALMSPGLAEPVNMEVTWDNPSPTPQTENLTRTKGDADTWQFNLVLKGVRFVGNPVWSYGPKGDTQNWGSWNETQPSVSWVAPPDGLKKAGTFFVSVTGDIELIPGPGGGGGGNGAGPKTKKMNASWAGNVFGIIIKQGDTDITDKVVNVIVGQKISLTTEITAAPPGKTPSSRQWNVPGSPVKGYTQTFAEGKIIDLFTEDTLQDHIDFYFITGSFTGATTDISYSVVIDGIPSSAKTTFKVLRPNATLSSHTSRNASPVDVRYPDFPDLARPNLELNFGSFGTYGQNQNMDSFGIVWTANVTSNTNGAGEIAFVQIVDTDLRARHDDPETKIKITSAGKNVLDVRQDSTVVQYGGQIETIGANDTTTLVSSDNPGQTLDDNYNRITRTDNFNIYLMYKPDGANSIWVTLRKLFWNWGGTAVKGNAPYPNRGWTRAVGATSAVDPESTDSAELPIWQGQFWSLEALPDN